MNEQLEYLINQISEYDDQLAFDKLYRHYFPGLYSFAYAILKNRQNAEEVILDVFQNIWENRKTLKSIKKLSNYLYVSCKYACISHLRKDKNISYVKIEEGLTFTLNSPEQSYISKENIHLINEVIATLPKRCLLIFRLVKEERLSYEEVAELLGISIKTVESQLHIAYKRLVYAIKTSLPEFKDSVSARK